MKNNEKEDRHSMSFPVMMKAKDASISVCIKFAVKFDI